MTEVWKYKVVCNGTPFMNEKISAYSGTQTQFYLEQKE